MVVARRKQVRLNVAQKSLVDLARGRLHELRIGHPYPGAHEGDAMPLHIGKVVVPSRSVARAGEVPTVFLGGEIVCSEGEKGSAVFGQEIAVDAQRRSRSQRLCVLDPESI